MTPDKPRIAVVHPRLDRGGSEARALWTLVELRDTADLTLITTRAPDLEALNRYYGTDLSEDDFKLREVPLPPLLGRMDHFAAVRGAFVHRFCHQVADEFDVMVSAYNPKDFGSTPGVHCVADFSFDDELRERFDPARGRFQSIRRPGPLRALYDRFTDAIHDFDSDCWADDCILSNSRWSARKLEERFDVESDVLYPPVPSMNHSKPWEDRIDGFVTLSRISPEQRILELIEIVARLRDQGHELSLTILGGPDDQEYFERVGDRVEKAGTWVRMTGWVEGEEKNRLLAEHKFGLNGRGAEAFGIAVAEMVQGGCIPFVPNDGGQVEIVGDERLTFEDTDTAVKRICTVLEDEEAQEHILSHLEGQAEKFSIAAFREGIREVVRQELADSDPKKPEASPTTANVTNDGSPAD